jgi:hypothetical protein
MVASSSHWGSDAMQTLQHAMTRGAAPQVGLSPRTEELSHGVDFPLVGPVTIGCDSKAALSLCEDHMDGQWVKDIDIIHHLARDHVGG